jgi:ABC-type transport system substrate-binding protein
VRAIALVACALLVACGNDPYPSEDAGSRTLYVAYAEAPKTLDPQVAYTVYDHEVIANVYETALEYHYLRRPWELIPALVTDVPVPEALPDGRVRYRFTLRPGMRYAADPCFARSTPGATSRDVVASDFAFALARIADPQVGSPVAATFAKIEGHAAFAERLAKLRDADPAFAALRIDEQYRRAGPIEGVVARDPVELTVTLTEPYPQLLFWFAMPFTSPVPWEAIDAYDGKEGRARFAEHAVGTGPFRVTHWERRRRIAFERNPDWWGARYPEWRAPAATYPTDGEPGDTEAGLLPPDVVGRPLPFLDRIEMRREKEAIPAFTKFVQGWTDRGRIPKESFEQAVRGGALSPEMADRGIRLERTVMPGVYYIGFNMRDPVVGAAAGERSRKLRQAMSLAIDAPEFLRVFLNGRGIPAQSPLPPGLFGYDPAYTNPFRSVDLDRARRLLAEAGYANGVDPATRKALRLSFDTGDPSVQGLLRYEFLVSAWRKLGLDVEVAATAYNQFQDKVRRGAYQVFFWGWVADYPDPENFYFLLHGPMGQTESGGPNTANFSDPRFDAIFAAMRSRPNDAERLAELERLRAIVETERPWIELFHPEDYALLHGWLGLVKPTGLTVPVFKYWTVDPGARALLRTEWNRPVLWPAFVLAAAFAGLVAAGVRSWRRERGA